MVNNIKNLEDLINKFELILLSKMLGSNVLGALVITGWAVLWSIALFGTLSWLGLFRLKLDEEYSGVDLTMHNEPAYWPKVWPPGVNHNTSDEIIIKNRVNSQ